MYRYKFRISIKWYKNHSGGDIRTICIEYTDEKDKKEQIKEILRKFRTEKMDIGRHKGEIPYSVSTTIPTFKKW